VVVEVFYSTIFAILCCALYGAIEKHFFWARYFNFAGPKRNCGDPDNFEFFPKVFSKDFEIARMISDLITSILKSLVIPAIWLALNSAIYSQIAPFFALNRILFSANENETVKQTTNKISRFFKTNQSHCRKMKYKKAHCLANLATFVV